MQLIAALQFGGAERLAATISASLPRERFAVSVCGFMGREGPLVEDLRRNGIPYHYLDGGLRHKALLARDLFSLLHREEVDILQIHGAYTMLHCFLPATFAGVRIIYTEHAKQTISTLRRANLAARYFSYGTSRVVCVSEDLKRFFRSVLKVPDGRLQVIHNGIDTERFKSTRDPFPRSGEDVTIGCIARLTEAKDHGNLLTAFAAVARQHQKVRLLLVGEGELRTAIEQKIADLGLSGCVDLLGDRNDIPELLASMDMFVLPSRREGFPVSILEAMAAGLPVVATDVGGVSEVISSGDNGLIVPPEDSEALACALRALLDDPETTTELAARGRATVCSSFSVTSMMERYYNLYVDVYRRTAGRGFT